MDHIGVGISTHRNPESAGRSAVRAALRKAGVASCDFAFVFSTVGYDQTQLLAAVHKACGQASLAGCSATGVIAGPQRNDSNYAVAVMVWKSESARFKTLMAEHAGATPYEAGARAARALGPIPDDAQAVFVFADGLSVNFERFRDGLEQGIGRYLPMLGGLAADNGRMLKTFQYRDGSVASDAVSIVLLSGQTAGVYAAAEHCCMPVGRCMTVTRASGPLILELDGVPAYELLKPYQDASSAVSSEPNFDILLVSCDAPDAARIEPHVIRGWDRDQKAIKTLGGVETGSKVRFAIRDKERVSHNLDSVAQALSAKLLGHTARAIFQFDFAGRERGLLREHEKTQGLARLQTQLGIQSPWVGFYGYGEIAPAAGKNRLRAYSATIAALMAS